VLILCPRYRAWVKNRQHPVHSYSQTNLNTFQVLRGTCCHNLVHRSGFHALTLARQGVYLLHLPTSPYFRSSKIESITSNSFVSISLSSNIPDIRVGTCSLYLPATHPHHDRVSRRITYGGISDKLVKSITAVKIANVTEQEAQQVWWAEADCQFLSMVTGKVESTVHCKEPPRVYALFISADDKPSCYTSPLGRIHR
jgi:hypothetical protein